MGEVCWIAQESSLGAGRLRLLLLASIYARVIREIVPIDFPTRRIGVAFLLTRGAAQVGFNNHEVAETG